ncbi:MAG: phytanoyl-CoA dioxygenase family protein, partial [Chloroflexi bacterium]|nr:phytanoyl-CoA dioxygenase family protein [Chloroflexota bacterium]
MAAQLTEDTQGADAYDSSLYVPIGTADVVDGFENVTDAEIDRFKAQGFLAIERAFTKDQIENAVVAVEDLIAGNNESFKGVQYERGVKNRLEVATEEERKGLVRKLQRFVGFDTRLDHFAENPDLLHVLSRIMGEPAKLYRAQAMQKPARIGREKPWHQDHAYFDLPMDTEIVSVWIALQDADHENGCMHVIPGSHLEGPVVHFNVRDWQICDTDVARDRVVAVPLKPGGILFWHGRLHHGSPANRSDRGRRSLQLHYIPSSVREDETSKEERLAVYGSDGKDVTC